MLGQREWLIKMVQRGTPFLIAIRLAGPDSVILKSAYHPGRRYR